MENQPGQHLSQVFYQIGCRLSVQWCPDLPLQTASLLTTLLLRDSTTTSQHDHWPLHRRQAPPIWCNISPTWASVRPSENKYGCLCGESEKGQQSEATLQFPKSSFAQKLFSFHILTPIIYSNVKIHFYCLFLLFVSFCLPPQCKAFPNTLVLVGLNIQRSEAKNVLIRSQ